LWGKSVKGKGEKSGGVEVLGDGDGLGLFKYKAICYSVNLVFSFAV